MSGSKNELEQLDALVRAAQRLREDWNTSGMARAMARDTFMCAVHEAPIDAARGLPAFAAGGPSSLIVAGHIAERERVAKGIAFDGFRYEVPLCQCRRCTRQGSWQ